MNDRRPPAPPPRRPAAAPRPSRAPAPAREPHAAAGPAGAGPLTPDELEALQALLDTLPEALDPLDVVQIDGYLCGLLLQPREVPEAAWLAPVMDIDARKPPPGFDQARLAGWLRRRLAELRQLIGRRQWFDPWIYELDDEATPGETVLPWVAGFATALDLFPALMEAHEPALLEPLATLYRHFDPDDLEDADDLLAEIETLAPPESLDEAVEDLVRSVLLIADVSHPLPAAGGGRPGAGLGKAGAPPRRPGSAGPRAGQGGGGRSAPGARAAGAPGKTASSARPGPAGKTGKPPRR